jgi:leucyl/phenylalanyl-tRNA--protein transferase
MVYTFDAERADETGLVAIGGDLEPVTLVHAYRSGVFPWFGEGDPILWWSPDPRAIVELDGLHVSRRLARTMRCEKFHLTIDRAFGKVIRGCADRDGGTWITRGMIVAYERLHRLGVAHSVEAWQGQELVGGIYGVALGGFFSGESMFSRVSDASKVALIFLARHLDSRGFLLFDTQVLTAHTRRMGAVELPRRDYLRRLRDALRVRTTLN